MRWNWPLVRTCTSGRFISLSDTVRTYTTAFRSLVPQPMEMLYIYYMLVAVIMVYSRHSIYLQEIRLHTPEAIVTPQQKPSPGHTVPGQVKI